MIEELCATYKYSSVTKTLPTEPIVEILRGKNDN